MLAIQDGLALAIWAAIGFILLILEVLTGTFIFLFFGGAAVTVAALKFLGLNSLPWEIFLFSALSLTGIFVLRKSMQRALAGNSKKFEIDQNQFVVLTSDLDPNSEGKIDYQGSRWTAVNESDQKLQTGEKVRILRTEGIKLFVRTVKQEAPNPNDQQQERKEV